MFSADGRVRIDRQLLAAKAVELDATIVRLVALRRGLRHAAACPAPSHLECPTFRRLLAQASGARVTPRPATLKAPARTRVPARKA